MSKKIFAAAVVFALSAGYTLSAFSQNPGQLVRQRQAAMTLHAKYFFPMFFMTTGKVPYDANIVARNAVFVDTLSQMPWDGFTEGTKGEKSRAMAEIYSNASGFKAAQDTYRGATTKLAAASKGGNEAANKAAIVEVDNACNACHKSFRASAQ